VVPGWDARDRSAEIQRLACDGGVDERTQERDYVLAWLIAGMAAQDFGPGAGPIDVVDAISVWCRFAGEETGIRAAATADDSMARRRAWVPFAGPLAAGRDRAIKVDLATWEEIVGPIARRSLWSVYPDLPDGR